MIFNGKRMSMSAFYDMMDKAVPPVEKDLFKVEIQRLEDDVNAFPCKKNDRLTDCYAVIDNIYGIPVIRTFIYSYIPYLGIGNFYECKRDFLETSKAISRGRYWKGWTYEYGWRHDGEVCNWTSKAVTCQGYFIHDSFDYSKVIFNHEFYGKKELEKANITENTRVTLFKELVKEPKYEIAFKLGCFSFIPCISELSAKQLVFLCKNNICDKASNMVALDVYDTGALKAFASVSANDLETFTTNTGYSKFDLIKFAKSLKSRNEKQCENKTTVFAGEFTFSTPEYLDYLDNLRTLEIPLNRDLVFNKNFIVEHEILQKQIKLKINKEIERKYRETAKKYKWMELNDKFVVKVPQTINQFKIEGTRLHHCVYSNQYYKRVINGKSIILFIRKKDKPSIPYVTVELAAKDFSVRQNYAIRDSKPPKEVINFVDSISRRYKEMSMNA